MQRFTALEYLKIDIANSWGHDKLTWDQRIAWFDKHSANMAEMINEAEEPALFYAGCKAYNDALNGVASGYMISLDATSSGLQLLAVLTGDRLASELCNVVSTGKRKDAYTVIYDRMLAIINDTSKITRDDTKQAIMTSLYSSRAMPKKIFGEGALLDIFYNTMATAAPGAWELNEAMLGLWNSNADSHDWVLPDNFHVRVKVMDRITETVHFLNEKFEVHRSINRPTKEGRSLGANTTHSIDGMIVREITRRCDYNMAKATELYELLETDGSTFGVGTKTKDDEMVIILWDHYLTTGYLSARILDHLTEDNIGHVDGTVIHNLLETLPERPFKVVSIHDCFRVHPNYGNDLRWQYAHQLALIAKSELLSSIISQLVGKPVHVGKLDPKLWLDVQRTDYALS